MAEKLSDSPPTPDVIAANKKICEQQARAKLKDPEGARVKDIIRVGAANQYNNGPIFPGVTYTLLVNGKNGYGGYTGEKLHACTFTPDERTFSHTLRKFELTEDAGQRVRIGVTGDVGCSVAIADVDIDIDGLVLISTLHHWGIG